MTPSAFVALTAGFAPGIVGIGMDKRGYCPQCVAWHIFNFWRRTNSLSQI